jgi:hypothetical protein
VPITYDSIERAHDEVTAQFGRPRAIWVHPSDYSAIRLEFRLSNGLSKILGATVSKDDTQTVQRGWFYFTVDGHTGMIAKCVDTALCPAPTSDPED